MFVFISISFPHVTVCVCLYSGELECVVSDHRAFNMAQKAAGKDDFRFIPAGVNGVAERLSLVWDRAVVSSFLFHFVTAMVSGRLSVSSFVSWNDCNLPSHFVNANVKALF